MSIFSKIATLIIMFLFALRAGAESSHHHHDHDVPQQDAHLHGYVELTLAIEGDQLEIQLTSPAINIVGFEHKATSKQQLQAIEQAKQTLESPAMLFSFSGSDCASTLATAHFPVLDEHHTDHGNHEDHEDHESDKENHSEITASYKYNCSEGKQIDAVQVNLIKYFPTIEKIKAMWLSDLKQGASELTSESNLILIR